MVTIQEILKGKKEALLKDEVNYSESAAHEIAEQMFQQMEDLQDYFDELIESQKQIEQAITDTEHFIEIASNLNASEGYGIYKKLRELLRRRRDIKDEIIEIKPLIDAIKPRNLSRKRATTMGQIKSEYRYTRGNRVYNTRILVDEFGKTIENR